MKKEIQEGSYKLHSILYQKLRGEKVNIRILEELALSVPGVSDIYGKSREELVDFFVQNKNEVVTREDGVKCVFSIREVLFLSQNPQKRMQHDTRDLFPTRIKLSLDEYVQLGKPNKLTCVVRASE